MGLCVYEYDVLVYCAEARKYYWQYTVHAINIRESLMSLTPALPPLWGFHASFYDKITHLKEVCGIYTCIGLQQQNTHM